MRRWWRQGSGYVQVSIERLRVWLVLGTGVLVAVVAGFLGYAHFAAHRFLHDLPGRLGAEISREANGFTYSQSNGKRTLYTIHAARFVQRKNNVVVLHDVGIVLYDTTNRTNRIYGKEFEYDQSSGVLRAEGQVFLDLAAPAPPDAKARASYAAGDSPTATASARSAGQQVIHVKTSGVVFAQKEALATTDQQLEFTYGDVQGSAVGAEFHSDTGATLLRSQVRLNATRGSRPVRLIADRAELDRQQQQVQLERAQATLAGDSRGANGEQTASADHATVLLRTATSPERIHAEGSVLLTARGATVRAERGRMVLGASDQPQSADLEGNVRYVSDQANRHVEATAATTHARFGAVGELDRLLLAGGATAQQRESPGSSGQGRAADRTLTAQQIDLAFAGSIGQQRRWVKVATATGAAHLVTHELAGAPPAQSTGELGADTLIAHLRETAGQAATREELVTVDGNGHTMVRRLTAAGADAKSFGDTLHASFTPAGNASQSAKAGAAQTVQSAEQIGHVQVEQRSPAKGSRAASLSHATAERLIYDGATDQATLVGTVQVTRVDSLLWADRVTLGEDTGDTAADGTVKLSYRASPTAEPVQVFATAARLQHDSGLATFLGSTATPARMWQGGSAIEAPIIELRQREQTLFAHAAPGQSSPAVRTVLANTPAPTATASPKRRATPAVRVLSRDLLYADATRTATFTGSVEMTEADMEIHATEALVYLSPKTTPANHALNTATPFPGGGSLDHIVATGAIRVEQPGREAIGDRLVYTASDRVSVLTGSVAKPPVVTDGENGTVSGAAIRFLPGDNGQNSVVVSGGGNSQPRVRSQTRGRQP